jgi:hypothetical protein
MATVLSAYDIAMTYNAGSVTKPSSSSSKLRRGRRAPEDMVYVRVGFGEQELRGRIKASGAIWRPRHKVWEMDWHTVRELGLQARVVIETAD